MPTTSFTQLEVWQKARQLTREVYKLTERFPRHQLFSLTSQTQRAVLSIGANIAEGYGRRAPRDKPHYYKREPGLVQLLNSICAMLVRLTQKTLTNLQ